MNLINTLTILDIDNNDINFNIYYYKINGNIFEFCANMSNRHIEFDYGELLDGIGDYLVIYNDCDDLNGGTLAFIDNLSVNIHEINKYRLTIKFDLVKSFDIKDINLLNTREFRRDFKLERIGII